MNDSRSDSGKRVILGVTGCIGAYKSALILRLLQKQDVEVYPVMTRSARQFLGPLTLEKLSGHRVIDDLWDDSSAEIEHISLARRGDLLLVAPATANVLGKFAHGLADDFLSTLYLSTQTPVMLAPAMNVEMWRHPATQENLKKLRERGVQIIEPGAGYLACGEVGEGRLAEPEDIVQAALSRLSADDSLKGRKVLVSAGPTIEDIDPVRYLSNRSSGRMGYTVAAEAARRGARVTLVSGPTQLQAASGIDRIDVRSAGDMAEAMLERAPDSHYVVMAAAVADFTPVQRQAHKIKKADRQDSPALQLQPTADILAALGSQKPPGQILIGFAAESENLEERARRKLESKHLDWIVANDITSRDSGFASQNNRALLLCADGSLTRWDLMSKREMARRLWDAVLTHQPTQTVKS
ncbi:MAG TPA: bifunctional phosphopantothenoylcysteine decarboxylase/phosphopantothenate--cysteine ligase CoaBC [Acidobacteriota bacterium]|nr:bifunctional phosphopantothenoylcysteine decarboxylase/phosphopantothenate--cysteine ligase CoaBC [Acidobacteriota bacterium]